MTRSSLTVIKVGGSLFDWPELPRRMTDFLDARKAVDRDERMVLIAGGGPAADVVRALDRIHGLGDQTAHRLALHAMDLTAIILAAALARHRPRPAPRCPARGLVRRIDPRPGSALLTR